MECVKNEKVVRELKGGESFGEQALYQSGMRTLSVRAGSDCKCLALSRNSVQEILGAKIQQVIEGNWSRWAIEKNDVFTKLTKLQIEKWIQNAVIRKVSANEIILAKNNPLTKLIIVIGGDLAYGSQTISKGSVFGSHFMFPSANLTKKLSDDLKATGSEATISETSVELFSRIIGGKLEEVFNKNKNSHEVA